MAGNLLNNYGTTKQTITCTITSLANNGQRQSTVIDNSSNLYQDELVMVVVKSNASGTTATGYVNIYAYGTVDTTTPTYSDTVTGTDGSVTLTVPVNVHLIGSIMVVANSTTYNGGPFSVAAAFGGVLPQKWGIIVENKTGATLDASIGSCYHQGVYTQYT